jgi:hypothetical protein
LRHNTILSVAYVTTPCLTYYAGDRQLRETLTKSDAMGSELAEFASRLPFYKCSILCVVA